jgi:hypothetical protein
MTFEERKKTLLNKLNSAEKQEELKVTKKGNKIIVRKKQRL